MNNRVITYSILRVIMVYEMTYDWTATLSIQSSFDCLVGRIPVFCTLGKNWFACAIGGTLKMLPRCHRSFRIPIRHVRHCSTLEGPTFLGNSKIIKDSLLLCLLSNIEFPYKDNLSVGTLIFENGL